MKHKGINAQSESTIGEMQERRSIKKLKKQEEERGLEQILSVPVSDGGRHRRRNRRGGECEGTSVCECVCVRMQIDSPEGEHRSGVGEGGIRGRWELN